MELLLSNQLPSQYLTDWSTKKNSFFHEDCATLRNTHKKCMKTRRCIFLEHIKESTQQGNALWCSGIEGAEEMVSWWGPRGGGGGGGTVPSAIVLLLVNTDSGQTQTGILAPRASLPFSAHPGIHTYMHTHTHTLTHHYEPWQPPDNTTPIQKHGAASPLTLWHCSMHPVQMHCGR